jgi:hypothetical protein
MVFFTEATVAGTIWFNAVAIEHYFRSAACHSRGRSLLHSLALKITRSRRLAANNWWMDDALNILQRDRSGSRYHVDSLYRSDRLPMCGLSTVFFSL